MFIEWTDNTFKVVFIYANSKKYSNETYDINESVTCKFNFVFIPHQFDYPSQAKRGGKLAIWRDVPCPSVPPPITSSSYTFGARGLKFSMHISHIGGPKVTLQIFDILSRS